MSDRDAFIAAIRADIDDDVPRLVFADWLEENGEEDHAAFLRFDVGYFALEPHSVERRELRDERREWLRLFPRHWDRDVRPFYRKSKVIRGFTERVALPGETAQHHLATILRHTPLRRAEIDVAPPDWDEFFATPAMAELRELDFNGEVGVGAAFYALLRARALDRLEGLSLNAFDLTADEFERLLACDALRAPRRLTLVWNYLDNAAVEMLAGSPRAGGLRELNLGHNVSIDDAGARAVADSPHLAGLEALSLWRTAVRDAGVAALADSPHMQQLRELNLRLTPVTDRGVEALAASPHLDGLRVLSVSFEGTARDRPGLTERSLRAVARSLSLASLRRLTFDRRAFTDRGVEHLVDSPHLNRLTAIHLEGGGDLSPRARRMLRHRFPDARLTGVTRPA